MPLNQLRKNNIEITEISEQHHLDARVGLILLGVGRDLRGSLRGEASGEQGCGEGRVFIDDVPLTRRRALA